MVHFTEILRKKYPNAKFGCQSRPHDQILIRMSETSLSENDQRELQKKIDELPSVEDIISDEKANASVESNLEGLSVENIHMILNTDWIY